MRHISVFTDGAAPAEEWVKKSEDLRKQLSDAADAASRSAIIKANEKHWKDLLAWLLGFSSGKCWYSEARDCVQYWEVEHFRPKGAVKKSVGLCNKGGYWWLVFDWQNYRVAGQVINRKKSSYFPLREGTFVADSKDKPHKDETPYFLDPTDENDCELVFFDETGSLVPKPGADDWEVERVAQTRDRFNLNYSTLVDYRKTVWQHGRALIAEYMNLMKEHRQTKSVAARAQAKKVLQQLREAVQPDMPFSAVAITCLVAANEPSLTKAVLAR